jgi:RNA polymerase sigma-70 factor (family 1)
MYLSTSDIENLIYKIAYQDDQTAFRKFFDYYYPGLNDFARHYVKSNLNSEEIVTDVFVKIWNIRKKLVEIKNLQAYLFTITKRDSLNYIRNNKLNSNLHVQLENSIKMDCLTPEDEFLSKEVMQILTLAINDLPEKCRLVFQMVKENGLKYKEVAKMLNISEKAVEMHISKALKRIKICLSEYHNPKINLKATKKLISYILVFLSVI